MKENYSESYENLLNDINKILMESNKLNSKEKRLEFFKQNIADFVMLKNNLEDIANKYLIKENNNLEQNRTSNIFRKIIIETLNNESVWENQKVSEDYRTIIINMLSHYENRLMFRLRRSNDVTLILQCLEYQKDRQAYIRAIKNNKIITDNYFNERAIRNYINDSYERTMFENLIRIIKDDKVTINKRDAKKIIKHIDSLEFLRKILGRGEEKCQVIDRLIIQKYADTIIPFKVIVFPESLEKDRLIVAFLNGKIKSERLYLQIANAIPIEEFESLIFAINLKNTSRIIREVKLGNLSEKEKQEINRLLEKAGITVDNREEIIEDDENYLVTIQDLKNYYDEISTEKIYIEKAKFYKANINEKNGEENLNSTERKTYLEISIIIGMMTKKIRKKISPKFIEFIERNKSKTGNTEIDKNKKLRNQKLRNKTKVLLALIYRDYMCTEEERKQLIKMERMYIANNEKVQEDKSLVLIDDLTWYQRLIVLIKRAISKRNNM